MRAELNNIERIDRYVRGELKGEELLVFEQELSTNPLLKEQVATQAMMLKAIERKALRAEIAAYAPGAVGGGWSLTKIFGFIGGALLIGAFITWWYIANTQGPVKQVHKESDLHPALVSFSPNDSTENELANSLVLVGDTINTEPEGDSVQMEGTVSNVIHKSQKDREDALVYAEDSKCGGLNMLVQPDVQQTSFRAENGATIEGKDGAVVIIPKHAFLHQDGSVVKGKVDFELVEAIELDDMVLYNLTTTSGKRKLETGGMLYLNASQNGKRITVNPQAPLYIEIPTNEVKPGMMAFKGEVDGKGNIDWKNPQPLKRFLSPVDLDLLDFLPAQFEPEVQNNLPFKSHTTANQVLVDSLYYALAENDAQEIEQISSIDPINSNQLEESLSSEVTQQNSWVAPSGVGFENEADGVGFKEWLRYFFARKYIRGNAGVSGEVIDRYGNVLAGVSVQILQNQRTNRNSIITDEKGQFSFNKLESGEFQIFLTKEGYMQSSRSITYNVDKRMKLEIQSPLVMKQAEGVKITPPPFVVDESDTAPVVSSNKESENSYYPYGKNQSPCGINPISVQAIRSKDFQKTFIATKEFEERIRYLHQLKNGEACLRVYLNNLTKDLWESDQQVARMLTGKHQKHFEQLAAKKLTNLEDAEKYQDQLLALYNKRFKAAKANQIQLRKEYNKKKDEELSTYRREMEAYSAQLEKINRDFQRLDRQLKPTGGAQELVASNRNNRPVKIAVAQRKKEVSRLEKEQTKIQKTIRSRYPSTNTAASGARYATSWANLGWVNIDRYLKDIQSNPKVVEIAAESQIGTRVFQWLNNINTLTPINLTNGKGKALFPRKGTSAARGMENTYCFSIGPQGKNFEFAYQKYNPYKTELVTLETVVLTEEELRSRIKNWSNGVSRVLRELESYQKRVREAEERRKREEARRKEIQQKKEALSKAKAEVLANRNATKKAMQEVINRYAAEQEVMSRLKAVAFPCGGTKTTTSKTSSLEIPNAFTPDGDGQDDVLKVRGVNLQSFQMEVCHQNKSNLMFSTTNIDEGWDGLMNATTRTKSSDLSNRKESVLNGFVEAPEGEYIVVVKAVGLDGREYGGEQIVKLIRSAVSAPKPIYLANSTVQFPEGTSNMTQWIRTQKESLNVQEKGSVSIVVDVDSKGRLSNYEVLESNNPKLDFYGLRIVQTFPNLVSKNGTDSIVPCRVIIPVAF